MTDEDVTDTIEEVLKRFSGQQVDFADAIEQLRRRRNLLLPLWDKHQIAEYCYQLVSLLMESQKLINGEEYATDYIEEKTETLGMIVKSIQHDKELEQRKRPPEPENGL